MLMRLHKIRLGNQGFTLVELMIVVGILAVLGAVALPMITSTMPKYRLRSAARELVIDFKKAKVEAVKRNRTVVIEFIGVDTQNGSYRLFVNDNEATDGTSPRSFDPGDVLLATKSLPVGIVFTSHATAPFSGNQSGYNARGLPFGSSNRKIIISTNDTPPSRFYTLTLMAAGRVQLE